MFKRVVVGFDESEGSKDALALGRQLADRLAADLVLVGVVPPPTGGSLIPALPANAFTNLVEQARVGLDRAAAESGATAEIVEANSAARGLEELTDRAEGDLLVLGCAKSKVGTVRAGHKARVLMQGSSCAVVLTPVGYRENESDLSVVGAAVDGSPESRKALDAAVRIAGSGRVRVITVATDSGEEWGFWGASYALSELQDASKEAARMVLDEALEAVPGETTVDAVMLEGVAFDQLRDQSAKGLDLLCLGSRGYGPLLRVLLGSVTSELVHQAACPILILPRA